MRLGLAACLAFVSLTPTPIHTGCLQSLAFGVPFFLLSGREILPRLLDLFLDRAEGLTLDSSKKLIFLVKKEKFECRFGLGLLPSPARRPSTSRSQLFVAPSLPAFARRLPC